MRFQVGSADRVHTAKTAEAVTFVPHAITLPDPNKIRAILNACPERDDPRLLARMAFGITSPRLTIGKWSTTNPYFGSMVEVDFTTLVNVFAKECEKAGYTRTEPMVAVASKKRSSSGGNRGDSSRGGGSKRAKFFK